jgi:hypothetical protein
MADQRAVVLIAIGIAGPGIELASRIRGTIWRPLSFATSAALLLAVLVSTLNLQNDLAQVLPGRGRRDRPSGLGHLARMELRPGQIGRTWAGPEPGHGIG